MSHCGPLQFLIEGPSVYLCGHQMRIDESFRCTITLDGDPIMFELLTGNGPEIVDSETDLWEQLYRNVDLDQVDECRAEYWADRPYRIADARNRDMREAV